MKFVAIAAYISANFVAKSMKARARSNTPEHPQRPEFRRCLPARQPHRLHSTRVTVPEQVVEGVLFDRYEPLAPIGTGGTSIVYEATDLKTGARVALKVLKPDLAVRADQRSAFLIAARNAMRVSHPGVVRVHDFGERHDEHGSPQAWIAMELVRGTTLAQWVRRHGPLSITQALELGEQLLDAVDAAHGAGLVHRDITPSNVMLSEQGAGASSSGKVTARLFDFGLAAPPGDTALTNQGLIWGSAKYLSPEQATGAPVFAAGDIYQVGAVLHFALTGQPPFTHDSDRALLHAHVSETPIALSALRSDVPRVVDRLVRQALEKLPDERFVSAREMRWAVSEARISLGENEVTTAELVPVSTLGAPPASLGHAQRRVRPAGLIAAVVLGASVVVGGVTLATALLADGRTPDVQIESTKPRTPKPTPTPEAPAANTVTAPTLVSVPQLTGLSLAEARAALETAGLTVSTVTVEHGTAAVDTVIASELAEGVQVDPGSAIALTVASGSNYVPELVGLTSAEAEAQLLAFGFVSGSADPQAPNDARVIGAYPTAGAVAPLGSTVTYVLEAQLPPVEEPIDPVEPVEPEPHPGEQPEELPAT